MDAFKRYDFEGDENWKAYISRVELPSGDNEQARLRVRAKWYKKNVDPQFDLSLIASGGTPSAGAGAARTTTNATNGSSAGTGNGTGASSGGTYTSRPSGYAPPPPPRAPPPRYGTTGSGTYGNMRAQRWLFFMHVGMLLLGVFAVVPFLPYARPAYVYLMRLSLVTLAYRIYLQHGLPSFRPLSLAMAWAQRVMPTADFLQLITAFSFSAQPPLLLVAAPLLVLAAYHAAAFAAAHFGGHPAWQRYGARVHAVMLRKQSDAALLNAACEVGTAGVLLLQLLTPARSLLTLFLYGQILKLKLHVPDCATQHRAVWRKIDQMTLPYRMRMPAIEQVVQMGVRWFMNVPGAH